MFDSPHTVQITFQPADGSRVSDLNALANRLTTGLNSAEVTTFEERPAVTALVRVYCFGPAATLVALDWVKRRLGELDIMVLRRWHLPSEQPVPMTEIHFTKEFSRYIPKRFMRIAREAGFLDLRHAVVRPSSRIGTTGVRTLMVDADVESDHLPLGNLAMRRAIGPKPVDHSGWRLWVNFVVTMSIVLLPAISTWIWYMNRSWWVSLIVALVDCSGLVVVFFKGFDNEERHWIIRIMGAATWLGMLSVFGWIVASNEALINWQTPILVVGFLFVFSTAKLLVRDHPSVLRPALAASLAAPALSFGAVLWGWSASEGIGIPADVLALSTVDKFWIAWPAMQKTALMTFVIITLYVWLKWFGMWSASRDMVRHVAPLFVILCILMVPALGVQSANRQVAEMQNSLERGEIPGGAMGSRVSLVCVEPELDLFSALRSCR